jgi:queuosine precursor transporter
VKNYRFLVPITGLFTATLLIANTLDNKIFMFGSLALPAGIILFPLAYVFGDVLTEVYGYAQTRKVIWTGLAALILMVGSYEIARVVSPAPFWKNQKAFVAILGNVPRIVFASICAYFAGEFCNSFVVAKVKVRMQGRFMALRFVLSTVVGQFVDTSIFVILAFTGVFPPIELLTVTASAWLVKVAWEVVALPITLPVVRLIKRLEQEDYFDTDTDFRPFVFGAMESRAEKSSVGQR